MKVRKIKTVSESEEPCVLRIVR